MKKFFKLFALFLILGNCFSLWGLTANYTDEDVRIDLIYTDTLVPGDAIFVRMTIQTPKSNKRSKDTTEKNALLKLYQGKKNIETASIIQIFELSLHSKSIKINNQMDDYPANSNKLLG